MDIDNEVFVSSYQFALPEIQQLRVFVEENLHKLHVEKIEEQIEIK